MFVHISAVERAGMGGLDEGQKLSYEIEAGRDGKSSAVNLKATQRREAPPSPTGCLDPATVARSRRVATIRVEPHAADADGATRKSQNKAPRDWARAQQTG